MDKNTTEELRGIRKDIEDKAMNFISNEEPVRHIEFLESLSLRITNILAKDNDRWIETTTSHGTCRTKNQ